MISLIQCLGADLLDEAQFSEICAALAQIYIAL